MNGRRPKLRKPLADAKVQVIVVERRDRLARFGFKYLEAAMHACGRRLRVVEDVELSGDLVRDMCEVLTSLCALRTVDAAPSARPLLLFIAPASSEMQA